MTWNEFKLAVDTYLDENNLENPEIDYIDITSDVDFKGLDIAIDECGLSIFD